MLWRDHLIKTFISVFEGHEGTRPLVRDVQLIDQEGTLRVETRLGVDYVMSRLNSGTLKIATMSGEEEIHGHFAVGSVSGDELLWKEYIAASV